ncbi:mediator of RNA polymerase II transcription subunit 26 isoform 1-T1 [Menidia menidia]
MTAATVMRDRLLQAIDGQSNQVRNMVVVMEVISHLEKYPITKEALEETRLGKLINDVRKKTKNEDLAKRAKKLLRNWQKLIEPGKNELLSKGLTGASWSNGSAHPCISTPTATPPATKTGPELKNRNDFNNCSSRAEKTSNKKPKGEQKEGQVLSARIPQTTLNVKTQNSKQLPANGLSGSAETLSLDREVCEPLDKSKLCKIPIHAVKPHSSAPGHSRPPSTPSLIKSSVLQQQVRQEAAASVGQYQPRSPRCSGHSPHTSPKHEAVVRQTLAPAPGLGESAQPFTVCIQGIQPGGSGHSDLDSPSRPSSESVHSSATFSCGEAVSLEDEGPTSNIGKRKRQKYRPKDYVVNLDGQTVEEGTKPVRLKDRRLTFDPVTGQIKASCQRDSSQEGEDTLVHRPEQQATDQMKQNPQIVPSPFQQTDWKELSRSEIIQSYLSQQSHVLTSSGTHTPGAHFFMTEFFKKEEHLIMNKDAKNTHTLAFDSLPKELPGVNREINNEDLNRLHTQHWSGVNGCFDTKGKWYDWTECISLDPHGDESRLNILPYVCLD